MNGVAVHGGFIPYGALLVFMSMLEMQGMAAIMKQRTFCLYP